MVKLFGIFISFETQRLLQREKMIGGRCTVVNGLQSAWRHPIIEALSHSV
jgi:hypothetical protein